MTVSANSALPLSDARPQTAAVSVVRPEWEPSWLCLNSGALPGNHRVLTRRSEDRLLIRIPASTPLRGFASGSEVTVMIESADGSVLRSRGLIEASARSDGDTDPGAGPMLELHLG